MSLHASEALFEVFVKLGHIAMFAWVTVADVDSLSTVLIVKS